jgi:hypothetical protein
MMLELDGAMARSPIDETGYVSKMDVNVVPLLVVFHSPPVANPT